MPGLENTLQISVPSAFGSREKVKREGEDGVTSESISLSPLLPTIPIMG